MFTARPAQPTAPECCRARAPSCPLLLPKHSQSLTLPTLTPPGFTAHSTPLITSQHTGRIVLLSAFPFGRHTHGTNPTASCNRLPREHGDGMKHNKAERGESKKLTVGHLAQKYL